MSLDAAIERFVERLRSTLMSQRDSARLAELLRIQRYHESAAEQALAAAALRPQGLADARVAAAEAAFLAAANAVLAHGGPTGPADSPAADLGTMEVRYEEIKTALLAAGADARLALAAMEQALRRFSALRRGTQQFHKSRRRQADRP
ncbi:hypothetical protein GCM10007320_14980 [Pseudorhodoferax aquiterrae]|uniref:DUF2383 domain-containing protein n=1 Tax=Pseudorhodoferax aquiterrae TaxID=747304 RepID=A0ABQ3FYG6_9BURK|nr:hypothetical protein [Pseudorhodoferax aquiterrae]GHC76085.1 hypothetical protein GCM10007320_14980 [Pseudorhodoferax aquiterrae]